MNIVHSKLNKKEYDYTINSYKLINYYALLVYIVTYCLIYIKYTYFSGSGLMLFTEDIWTQKPIGLDLYTCIYKWSNLLNNSTNVPDSYGAIYSPLSVYLYSLFKNSNFEILRFIIIILTYISFIITIVLFAKIYNVKSFKYTLIYYILITFNSYGVRFELERGQLNVLMLSLITIALYITHKDYKWSFVFSLILYSLAIQMKIWPIFLLPLFFDSRLSLITNIKRYTYIIFSNILLLFVFGKSFFSTFYQVLIKHNNTISHFWMANMSMKSFEYQLLNGVFILKNQYGQFNILTNNNRFLFIHYSFYFIKIISISTMILLIFSRIKYKKIFLFYITIALSLLIVNVSMDYKLSLFYISSIVLFLVFRPSKIFINKKDLYISKNNLLFLTELTCLLLIYTLFPITLFSYIYKFNFIYLSVNTIPIAFSLLSICIISLSHLFKIRYN